MDEVIMIENYHKNEYLLSIALKEQVIPEVPMYNNDYKLDEIIFA